MAMITKENYFEPANQAGVRPCGLLNIFTQVNNGR